MNYTVIDLVNCATSSDLITNFKSYIFKNCQSDLLYENYANLNINDFICLTAVIEGDEIIALSGIQYMPDRWGEHTVRMSTRFWMHPKYRINSLSKFDPDMRFYFNSQLMIPHQLNFLKKIPIKFAIITREGNYRRSFEKFIKLVNHHNNTNFSILDGLYNVCQPMETVPHSCQQIIAVHSLNNTDFQLELVNLQKLNKLSQVSK